MPADAPTATQDSGTAADRIPIDQVSVQAYTVPTDAPESDGTLEWHATTLVLATVVAGGKTGIGYTYADLATATLIRDMLAPLLLGHDAMATRACWLDMRRATRNLGRGGITAMAIAAVDAALWDWKGRMLNAPVATLLGSVRDRVPVYGSGGFTSYTNERLADQLSDWAASGITMVKMKVGRDPERDVARVRTARRAIGTDVALFVDANGAWSRKQALRMAALFADQEVSWLEEPVSSDDLEGLRLIRDRGPAGMNVAAGEYGYDTGYFRRMLSAGAVDVLQADASRCAGITGFMQAAAVCDAFGCPLSAHCAPALHRHPACAALPLRHIEYFHDHQRIERLFFDGADEPRHGVLTPDWSRPGLGLTLRAADAARYAV